MLVNKLSEVTLEIGMPGNCFELQRKYLLALLKEIRSKVDSYSYDSNILSKFKTICSHCGHDWTDEKYDGSCCEKALEEFRKALEGAACGGF